GTIDLGTGVARNNALSQAARQGARQVIVQGSMAPAGLNGGPWGPGASYPGTHPYTVRASSTSDRIASPVRPYPHPPHPPTPPPRPVPRLTGHNNPETQVEGPVTTTPPPALFFFCRTRQIPPPAASTTHTPPEAPRPAPPRPRRSLRPAFGETAGAVRPAAA